MDQPRNRRWFLQAAGSAAAAAGLTDEALARTKRKKAGAAEEAEGRSHEEHLFEEAAKVTINRIDVALKSLRGTPPEKAPQSHFDEVRKIVREFVTAFVAESQTTFGADAALVLFEASDIAKELKNKPPLDPRIPEILYRIGKKSLFDYLNGIHNFPLFTPDMIPQEA